MKTICGIASANRRKRFSFSRSSSSARIRSVISTAIPPISAGLSSQPGIGNLLTME